MGTERRGYELVADREIGELEDLFTKSLLKMLKTYQARFEVAQEAFYQNEAEVDRFSPIDEQVRMEFFREYVGSINAELGKRNTLLFV